MNIYRYLLLALLCIALGCEEGEPDYPIEPYIEFKTITYEDGATEVDQDTITFKISYRDGDGDLGRSHENDSSPFNRFYAFTVDNGIVSKHPLEPVTNFTFTLNVNSSSPSQRVITKSLRAGNEITGVPEFNNETACDNYVMTEIKPSLAGIMPLSSDEVDNGFYYDTILIERNEYYYNILIDFFIQEGDGEFVKWEFPPYPFPVCSDSFYGIMPIIDGNKRDANFIVKGNRTSGSITMELRAYELRYYLENKKVKLRIQIIDNAQHKSNIVETDVLQF
jgi:hypothetical protein